MLQWLIQVRSGGLDTVNWSMQGIHAWRPSSDACMSFRGRMYESSSSLWPAVLAVGPLCISEMFMCMSYDWGINVIVRMHRGPIMFRVQFVVYLNWTGSTLERSHAFVIGDVAQVQRG